AGSCPACINLRHVTLTLTSTSVLRIRLSNSRAMTLRCPSGPGRSDWPEDIVQEAFLDEECGPVCSPDLVQRCPLVHPEDLRYHTLLHTDTRKHAWYDWLRLTG